MSDWTEWQPFPDPQEGGYLYGPFGPGVYELRNRKTGEFVLFGSGKNLACRMSSLLPSPLGQGTRNNSRKRDYVVRHLSSIEYRTVACKTEAEAKAEEKKLRASGQHYLFNT